MNQSYTVLLLDAERLSLSAMQASPPLLSLLLAGQEEAVLGDDCMDDSDDGIVTRALKYLFQQLEARSSGAGAPDGGGDPGGGCRYSLRVSVAEIYCEQVYDLIHFDKTPLQVNTRAQIRAGDEEDPMAASKEVGRACARCCPMSCSGLLNRHSFPHRTACRYGGTPLKASLPPT